LPLAYAVAVLYWFLKWFVIGPVARLLWWPWVQGREHVPASGGAIVASNHVSFSDSVFMPLMLSRRVTFLAKSEYFTSPGIRGALVRWFMLGIGQVPIDRSGGRASEAAILTGVQILRDGNLLGIYPEGTRSPDGRLYKGRTGTARMAIDAQVPVIPVAMINTFWIQPTGRVMPRLGRRIGVRFGAPIDTTRFEGRSGDVAVLRQLTEEIMAALRELGEQQYVDIYATKAKELLTDGVDPAQFALERFGERDDSARGDEPARGSGT
jgi:1-acyl-sn-glycerol-3-phosphate acyltransferase